MIWAILLMSHGLTEVTAPGTFRSYGAIRLQANPFSIKANAKSSAACSISGPEPIIVPTYSPDALPPIEYPSLPTVHWAWANAARTKSVMRLISPVLPTINKSKVLGPYLRTLDAISDCCAGVRLRSAMRFFRMSSFCSAERISVWNDSASLCASVASVSALDAAVSALLDSRSALPRDVSAAPALDRALSDLSSAFPAFTPAASALLSATPDLSSADCAFVSALVAFSLREPISCPEMLFVWTRQNNSTDSDTINSNVDRLANRFFRRSSPAVNQSVKSAMYSPAQAIATNAHATYSAHSQCVSDCAKDDTSEAVKVILGGRRRYDITTERSAVSC